MHKQKKKIKLYQVEDTKVPIMFWTTQKPFLRGEKLIKTKIFDLPLKEGFYGKDYLNSTDVEFIKKELKQKR